MLKDRVLEPVGQVGDDGTVAPERLEVENVDAGRDVGDERVFMRIKVGGIDLEIRDGAIRLPNVPGQRQARRLDHRSAPPRYGALSHFNPVPPGLGRRRRQAVRRSALPGIAA